MMRSAAQRRRNLPFTEADIQRTVSCNAYWRALDSINDEHVLHYELSSDGSTITGQVQGTRSTPYQQTIHIRRDASGRRSISGDCTCPMAFNCKHVAAVLLEILFDEDAEIHENDSLLSQPLAPPSSPPSVLPLPPPTKYWIRSLGKVAISGAEDYPANVTRRAIYVLKLETRWRPMPGLAVFPSCVNLRKDGTFSEKVERINVSYNPTNPPNYLRANDCDILWRLSQLTKTMLAAGHCYPLSGERGMEPLRLIHCHRAGQIWRCQGA